MPSRLRITDVTPFPLPRMEVPYRFYGRGNRWAKAYSLALFIAGLCLTTIIVLIDGVDLFTQWNRWLAAFGVFMCLLAVYVSLIQNTTKLRVYAHSSTPGFRAMMLRRVLLWHGLGKEAVTDVLVTTLDGRPTLSFIIRDRKPNTAESIERFKRYGAKASWTIGARPVYIQLLDPGCRVRHRFLVE